VQSGGGGFASRPALLAGGGIITLGAPRMRTGAAAHGKGMADAVRLKHRVEYAAFRAGIAAGRLLSDARAARVGEAFGRAGYRLGIKKRVVEANLRIAFPHADAARIDAIARGAYAHLGRETMMTLRLSWATREQVIARTRLVGEDVVRAEYERGRGVIFAIGHLGNWEIAGAAMAARGYRLAAIGKRAANPLFYARVMQARQRMGVEIIDFHRASRPTLKALREGYMVAFAADQHAGTSGIMVPFFGRPASTYRGPALMALRTGAPLYLATPLRMPDGMYELTMDRLDTTPTGDLEADVLRVTAAYSAMLEAAVRANPDQYLWHHRRWRGPAPVAEEQQADGAV
jgi:lauroyl/myristoyl acyltransferase